MNTTIDTDDLAAAAGGARVQTTILRALLAELEDATEHDPRAERLVEAARVAVEELDHRVGVIERATAAAERETPAIEPLQLVPRHERG